MQTQLPPINENQLPQWSRVGHLDRTRYPKAFGKDHFRAIQQMADEEGAEGRNDAFTLEQMEQQNPVLRIQYLERSIEFLRQQHREILDSLHKEIEKIRTENKELQFKLVMSKKMLAEDVNDSLKDGSSAASDVSAIQLEPINHQFNTRSRKGVAPNISLSQQRTSEVEATEEAKDTSDVGAVPAATRSRILEEQVAELRHQLREVRGKNTYLVQLLDAEQAKAKRLQKTPSEAVITQLHSASSDASSIDMDSLTHIVRSARNPLTIRTHSGKTRMPTTEECERIIRHLQLVNEQQTKELVHLKSDLKEVLYSQKWTPDAYLLAKAYVIDEEVREGGLPKVQIRTPSRKLPEVSYVSRDNVSLPALKQTMGTKAVERRKRTQILQKARLRKEVL